MSEEVRGTKVEIILERDRGGKPSKTIERTVPRELLTKVQYRNKSKQNASWKWSGTVRMDLSEEGLIGERSGMVDIKYIEGGVFVEEEQ